MPIYEYECLSCGKTYEVWQKITDKPLTKCEVCSGKLRKLISHSSFHLKGSGWYVTDYRDSKRPGSSSAKSNSDSTSKNPGKPSESGDSK
ncbi:MAG: FmdB family transcriptional regulator [Desulfococcus sp. 4484_241]|nr:MAG: FmdB family transcriptional regulator [Desulfococcus sp. 4484_241]